ncbi:unnamed protein product [Urochloa humidicola]
MDDMGNKLGGLEALMQKLTDKFDDNSARLHRLETAPQPSEIQKVLDKLDATALRITRLEAMPTLLPSPPPQRQEKVLPQPRSHWVKPIDLNTAPQQETRPSASTWERPNGHRVESSHRDARGGGGILGSSPPHSVTGMAIDPQFRTSDFASEASSSLGRSDHKPKMEFPKFDGTNPRL